VRVVLGEVVEAEALIRKAAKNPEKARRVVVAVATRHRGWGLVEVAGERTELEEFVGRMQIKCK
jgi:hypothetical protein